MKTHCQFRKVKFVALAAAGVMSAFSAVSAAQETVSYGSSGTWDAITWTGATRAYQLGGDFVIVFEDVTDAEKSFTLADETKMSVLCVAGGGGCGAYGCGAGAGGMLEDTGVMLAAGTYAVTVGADGAGSDGVDGLGGGGGGGVMGCRNGRGGNGVVIVRITRPNGFAVIVR